MKAGHERQLVIRLLYSPPLGISYKLSGPSLRLHGPLFKQSTQLDTSRNRITTETAYNTDDKLEIFAV